MSNIKYIIISSLFLAGLYSCSNPKFEQGAGGMQYKLVKDESGEPIKEGDYISINFTDKTEEGALISKSEDYRPTMMFCDKPAFKGDYFTALQMLSEGDSAVFKINADSVKFKSSTNKRFSTKSNYILYTVKVNKVLKKGKMDGRDYTKLIEEMNDAQYQVDHDMEGTKIKNYISQNKLNPVTTKTGLNYIIKQQGQGPKPALGDTSIILFTGKTLSGQIFETTIANVAKGAGIWRPELSYHPIKMLNYVDNKISGFREATMLFPKGTKATLIIPSALAFGRDFYKTLGPYTPIICEMEILNIKKPHKS